MDTSKKVRRKVTALKKRKDEGSALLKWDDRERIAKVRGRLMRVVRARRLWRGF